ncbi:MAG: pyridine nucleotide-disulfide oxidoreductase [Candidatus Omnitrophota bacterium]|nr:MAG: pyridine nucleotide-disulfide oxidoreductase [Candidatus Omnitrophota bacterium]
MSGSKCRIVIVGGVACGPKAAARSRRRDPNAEIILIERGKLLSYAGCGLPYFVGGAVPELDGLRQTTYGQIRDEDYFRDVKNIDVRLCTEAVEIDRCEKKVHLRQIEGGAMSSVSYDRLVLATGSRPVIPPIAGIDLEGVFNVHAPADAEQIRRRIDADEVNHAVIIGAGLIGLEMCESLFNHAVDATVLEMKEHALPAFLDFEMAAYFQKELVRDGIELATGQRVLRLEGDGRVSKVITQDKEIETDMVILAAGVRPNVDLARAAGLAIGETGAIAVNEYLQTNDPDIYAGGDCVECVDQVSGVKVYAPLGSTANRHGRVIGDNLTGGRETFAGIVGTTVFKTLNLNIGKTGITEKRARELGYDVVTSITPCLDHAHFYPGGKEFLLKLTADRGDGRLLGAQLIGPGDVTKRVDILATALRFRATLRDVAGLDLGYSPPFSQAMDGVIHAANSTRNRLDGMLSALTPPEARERLARGNGMILLDVREAKEVEKNPMRDQRAVNIPLSELRRRMHELPQDAEILCICQVGIRGYEAGVILQGNGFGNVKYLDGGMRVWPFVMAGVESPE